MCFKDDSYKVELDYTALPEERKKLPLYSQRGGLCWFMSWRPRFQLQVGIQVSKLLSLAGAYWRRNSDNKMMQRIMVTAFFA